MTYETYRLIFILATILALVFLVVAIVLFFVLHIPQIVGDLSGRTARKAIQSIREQNEKTGDKVYKSSQVNIERGKITEKISVSGKLRKHDDAGLGSYTEKLNTKQLSSQAETTVLNSNMANETTVLTENMILQQFFVIEKDITFIHTNEVITI